MAVVSPAASWFTIPRKNMSSKRANLGSGAALPCYAPNSPHGPFPTPLCPDVALSHLLPCVCRMSWQFLHLWDKGRKLSESYCLVDFSLHWAASASTSRAVVRKPLLVTKVEICVLLVFGFGSICAAVALTFKSCNAYTTAYYHDLGFWFLGVWLWFPLRCCCPDHPSCNADTFACNFFLNF